MPRLTMLVVLAGLLGVGAPVYGQVVRTADATVRGLTASDFPRIKKLAENVYAYEDLNGSIDSNLAFTTNSLIVVTSDGVLVADGQGSVAKTKRLVDEVGKITTQPIRYVVICADHGDHIAGNSAFPSNVTFIAHPTSKALIERQAAAAAGRGGRGGAAGPGVPIPQETVSDKRVLMMGGTEMQILFLGRAHTGGDLHVYLPKEGILFMGEVFFNRLYPSVGGSRSGRPIEWIETITKAEAMKARIYVPDHGFVDSPEVLNEELVNFRGALENLVSEARRMHAAKVPLENAPRNINLGEFQYWYRAANNMPDAVRQVYLEIEGKLP
ncbi:MAG: MBL fold metallo-hydrolase [Acidobacteria bacterium]|nr:MBL fold metallo-hydrolase [Acidobacteriota bacterium]